MSDFLAFWRHYADFKGKTTIKGFWAAVLIWYGIAIMLVFVSALIALFAFRVTPEQSVDIGRGIGAVYVLLSIVPLIAIGIRRLRDAGYSAKSLFWLLVPGIGIIALLVRLCTNNKSESIASK